MVEDERTISEIERENSDLFNENLKYQEDIDKLLNHVKGIRKITKSNRIKITINKNIIKKRLGNTNEFNIGDKIEFKNTLVQILSNTRYFWLGSIRIDLNSPYITITKINSGSIRADYKFEGIIRNANINKETLRNFILNHTDLISKESIMRDEDIGKLLKM